MFFARVNAWRKTVRFRLTIWNAGVILATALLVLFGVRAGVQYAIQHEMDQILNEDIYEIELALADAGATPERVREVVRNSRSGARLRVLLDEFDRKAMGHEEHGWFAFLRSPDGELLWSSQRAPSKVPAILDVPDFRPQSFPGVRFAQSRRTDPPFSPLYVQVGISTQFLDRAMTYIDELVVLAVGVMLLTAGPLGYWLAGRTIRPVAQMIQATASYHPEKLDERLPVRYTGDELDQLALTVNGLLDRLAAYLSQHRDFLANSAHELRTPLAAIHAAVEVALAGNQSPARANDLLAGVLEQCSTLEVLVNQLLLLAETENERLKAGRHPCDLSAVVNRACRMFLAVAETRDIVLRTSIQPGVIVEGNPHHLRQVVNNLIDNALKFTSAGGRVDVILASTDGAAVLEVRDTGEGMSAADAARVFQRFFRADRARTHEGIRRGTGLGLSICQAVIEAHGGSIGAESELGRGSRFTVRLPALPPDEATVGDGAPPAAAADADTRTAIRQT